jgi:hypothetical protein
MIIFLLIAAFKYEGPLITPEKLINNIKSGVFQGKPMTLHCQRDDLFKVLKKFETVSGLKFEIAPSVVGKIRLFVNNLPWDQLLSLVLDKGDLNIELKNNTLMVKRKYILDFSQEFLAVKEFKGRSIHFAFKNMDIRNLVVELYSKFGNDYGRLEVVLYPGIRGKVTCDLGTIPWDKGLNHVVNELGLNMNITGNLMIIKKSTAFNKIHSLSSPDLISNLKSEKYSDQIIRLFIKKVSLRDFFKYLEHISRLNFKLDKNTTGELTVECLRIPWDKLLAMVLYSHYLDIASKKGKVLVKRIERPVVRKPEQKIMNTIFIKTTKPENFSFKSTDLESVINFFSDKYLLNLVYNPRCTRGKKVNYQQKQILWPEAFKAILFEQGLEFEFEEGDGVVGHFLTLRKCQ